MTDGELWKTAYRAQFGSDPDDDMADNPDEIEQWRATWQAAYDAGEDWAVAMVQDADDDDADDDEDA